MAIEIPKPTIRYLVGQMHVGKPDSYVRSEVLRRVAGHLGWTPGLVKQAQAYAVKVHHDNRRLYAFVMGGTRSNPARRRAPVKVATIRFHGKVLTPSGAARELRESRGMSKRDWERLWQFAWHGKALSVRGD